MREHLLTAEYQDETSPKLSTWKTGCSATNVACGVLLSLAVLGCIASTSTLTAISPSAAGLGSRYVQAMPFDHAESNPVTLATLQTGRLPVARSPLPTHHSTFLGAHSKFPVSGPPRHVPQVTSRAQGESGSAVISPPRESSHDASSVESIKASLLKVALLGGRGVWSRPAERDRAAALIEELERSSKGNQKLKDGVWELVVSDLEPFRASVFFLALAEAVEARIMAGASDGALTVHSLATGGGEVGRVAHVVEGNASRLHSLVELKSGSVPSIPLALTGTVISSGELTGSDGGEETMYSLSLKNTSVQGNKVKYGLPSGNGLQPGVQPDLLSWIGDQYVPSGDIFSSVLDPIGGGQTARLHLSYSDDDMMVWRTPQLGNHFFCFVRGEPESWPAMQELRERQAKAQQSVVGSAFALGMLNAFYTRRAGIRN
eukprot:gnl/MRDRNA2_/MRDRNA2_33804_c0_seq1.p1 gnl/MRDRNA2_/MRDRNA2_33804_c0~~gnl/MRDRNA2_/MRDRNA2_33804_c0_seq1.p1  ORF type:complete len:432 (-),score=61.58 gnl/MRDRNA2_/MRDRNA2_33804_c0_seq1:272-1567(-)